MNSILKGVYNDKDPKSKAGDYVRILIYKNIFAESCCTKLSKIYFLIRNVEINVPWSYEIENRE